MAYENTRNHEEQDGATWVIGGDLNIPSSGIVTLSRGGTRSIPVTSSSSNDAPIPNSGLCIISAAAATASDCRMVAAPTRAGLTLNLVSNCAASGVNVCVASGTSLIDIVIIDESNNPEPIWELVKNSSQNCRLVSVNTSQWQVVGPIAGALTTDGST